MQFVLVYFGKRGGGADLFQELHADLELNRRAEYIHSASLEAHSSKGLSSKNFRLDHDLKSLIFHAPVSFFGYFKLGTWIIRNRNKLFVVVMPSPNDYLLYKLKKIFNIKIMSIIHDYPVHPGNSWPRNKSIDFRIKRSGKVIALSTNVAESIRKNYPKKNISLFKHPKLSYFESNQLDSFSLNEDKRIFLFIGRIEEYKGVDVLVEAWPHNLSNSQLIIAGNGTAIIPIDKNIHFINKWLSKQEIEELISRAHVVVFPYKSATQSGLLPIVMAFNKFLIVSDLPGLVEQLENYPNAFIVEPGNSEKLRLELFKVVKIMDSGRVPLRTPMTFTTVSQFTQELLSVIEDF
jgi:glycosyltransferase involved in cell wall biosynthesis